MRTAALFLLILLAGITGLCGQERIDSRQEALMHYQQGKDFYSLGRYREATSEFEKALDLIGPPRLEFEAATREQAQKAITPETAPKIEIKKPAQAPQEPAAEGAGSAEEQERLEKEYYIDPGDVLDISVWQIPDLSKPEVIVRPDGKISFPLIGDLKAESLTLTQLDASITEKLKAYVKAPEVSVMIKRFGEQANKIVVLGEIFLPGVYKFGGPPSITEVVASAGGYTKYAVLNSIMVIRGDVRTRPEVLRVNFARIIKGSRLRENIFLKPNDIVYVPKSFIGNVNTFLEIFQPAINEYLQTLNARHLQHVVHSKGGV